MFPADELFLKAELDYRREQMLKARPPRRSRTGRRQRAGGSRAVRRDRGVAAA
ncbi:MAG TPA: hypothetical protein VF165_22600 [Nocardioidaceae bacterium]